MILLWLIMIALPLFIIVAIWTKLTDKLRCKIFITCIAVFSTYAIISVWTQYNELEEATNTIDYVVDRDMNYVECLDNSKDFKVMFDNCILPMTEEIRETYK